MKLDSFGFLKMYRVVIVVFDSRGRSYGEIDRLSWEGLRFDLITKWKWYFDYRQALKKIHNPRSEVTLSVFQLEPDTKTVNDHIKDKIAGKKRVISKLKNDLTKHKKWLLEHNIFGLDGDDGRIQKAEDKLARLLCELKDLEVKLYNS